MLKLEDDLRECKKVFSDLKLIVIDTLQKVRGTVDMKYGTDYKELSVLKSIADELDIAIILVHHNRKAHDSNPNNMISGTNGLAGCADGLLVFTKKSGDKNAVLNISGRCAPSLEINLVRENTKWKLLDAPPEYKKDIFPSAIHDFMLEQKEFRGTASELCELLRQKYSKYEFKNNWIYRDLLQHNDEIRSLGIDYGKTKSNGVRSIYVSYDKQRDTSGGIILCAEVVDPAVPDECANVDISSNTVDVDESDITTFAVPANGNDFIAMMAENLRNQLESQGIHVKPFNATE